MHLVMNFSNKYVVFRESGLVFWPSQKCHVKTNGIAQTVILGASMRLIRWADNSSAVHVPVCTYDTGPSVVGILIHAEEEDLVGGLVVDEEGERVVGDELRVEERPRRPEPEERRGGGRLAPLLVHFDERLVQRAVLVFSNVDPTPSLD